MRLDITAVAAFLALTTSIATASSCDQSKLNTTSYLYPITKKGTTIFDVARITKRSVCDIGRQNLMADVAIPPTKTNTTRTCIYGGPRLYYTVNGYTYDRIATRLNITTDALMNYAGGTSANETLPVGQFIKVPQCSPSQCIIQPYSFTWGVYKDLAEKFDTTVSQLMMLSPTYNYSSVAFQPGGTFPPINVAINRTALSNNITVLD